MRFAGLVAAFLIAFATLTAPSRAQSVLSPGFAATNAGLSPSERGGPRDLDVRHRLQRPLLHLHLPAAARRRDRLVRDPARRPPRRPVPGLGRDPRPRLLRARRPRLPGAVARPRPTGFLWCPGDDALLAFVGRDGYRDPACDFADAPFDASTPHGATDQRQNACDLYFGTSTGALGLRKFPNPRFDPAAWEAIGGWEGYGAFLSDDPASPDSRLNRLWDGSVEPPFRIGMACGACHIAYDPTNPPADPADPAWENIDALVGNQYSRISEHARQRPLAAPARVAADRPRPPRHRRHLGAADGLRLQPRHDERDHQLRPPPAASRSEVLKWRKASACAADADPARLLVRARPRRQVLGAQPRRPRWSRTSSRAARTSIGYEEAIQRVYFNIGSCAEQCWINHLTDLRAADPEQRNYGQTPFDIGQCRRDCGAFRAIEDRLADLKALLPHRAPHRPLAGPRPRLAARPRGRSSTPSSAPAPSSAAARSSPRTAPAAIRARRSSPGPPTSPRPTRTTRRCASTGSATTRWRPPPRSAPTRRRALHSNHMQSRVWAEYASLDRARRARPTRCARR